MSTRDTTPQVTLSVAREAGVGPWVRKASVLADALLFFPLGCFLLVPWALVGFSAGPQGR